MTITAPKAQPGLDTKSVFRLLIVDDHPIVRSGIAQLLSKYPNIKICGEAANAMSALHEMRTLQPDAALIDVSMPGTNGIELVKMMLSERPDLLILMLSMHDESLFALRALRAGAKGYVMKQQALENVGDAIQKVLSGGIYVSPQFAERLVFKAIHGGGRDLASPVDHLSDRELEVLQLFGKGKNTREVADALNISVKTIETHRMHIKSKLGLKDAGAMVRFATEWLTATSDDGTLPNSDN